MESTSLIKRRPSPSEPSPFSMIANRTGSLAAMSRAEKNPKIVLISDWDKYTSAQYSAAEQASNLDLLYAKRPPILCFPAKTDVNNSCVDSILVNGKGAVNCQPQSFLNSLINPNLGHLLAASNLTVSDKG